jgi:hypothetical protein
MLHGAAADIRVVALISKFGQHTEPHTVLTFWLPTPSFVKVTFGLTAAVI